MRTSHGRLRRHAAPGALLGALLFITCALSQSLPGPADALAVKRAPLAPERVPAELERVRQGALTRLPSADFEGRLRQALAAASAPLPQFAEARYRATLADSALAGTTGRYFEGRREIRSSEESYDEDRAEQLWQASEALTGSARLG